MGCMVGGGVGVKVALGEVNVARVNPYRFGQGEPPVHLAWFQPRWPTAVTQIRGEDDLRSVSYHLAR